MQVNQLVIEKEKTEASMIRIKDILTFPTYLLSSFKFKVHFFWFTKNAFFDFCSNCISDINTDYVNYIDKLYKKVIGLFQVLPE